MSHRPGIIKSAGLTDFVPLPVTIRLIPLGHNKRRASENAYGALFKVLRYFLFAIAFRAAAVALDASERVHFATLTRSDNRFRLFSSQKLL